MFIEFKVSNFRSIREEQVFSLVASNSDKDLEPCVIRRDLPGLSKVSFLKGAALYGANASGKSNVILAIRFLANFVKRSAVMINPGDPTGAEPFKLDQESGVKPSVFEITFVADNVRFVFGISVTPQRVLEEYLMAYPKGVPQRWYHRTFDQNSNAYKWANPSTEFKHDKSLQDKTRENSLFLSVGPQFNHPQLTPVFNWFKNNLNFLRLDVGWGVRPNFTANLILESAQHDRIPNLLRSADIAVTDAKIIEKEISVDEQRKNMGPERLAIIEARGGLKPIKSVEINLVHTAENSKSVLFNFDDEESAGTRRFFALIGPWTNILDNGYTVFVDELETSLHPILVKELLKLFFSGTHNPEGAQIVFTTHNPVLLDNTLMRRDQIWFTEKSPAGTTYLYPLTDYQPRKDESLAKGYLAGRYGAIPYFPDGLKL